MRHVRSAPASTSLRRQFSECSVAAMSALWQCIRRAAIYPILVVAHVASAANPAQERASELADRLVATGKVPGIMVGRWTRTGEGSFVLTHGVSDLASGRPMSADNSQRIGSVTKSFTVTRILQLTDEGRLSLDDPIGRYVKGLRNGNATLRELANMTSGIFNYSEDHPFVVEFVSDLTRRWTDRQLVDVANAHRPYFPPGRRWYYSNTNTVLLGMVIEQVSGNSLRRELTKHLLAPLGMRRTLYPNGVDLPVPFSRGYLTLDPQDDPLDVTRLSPTSLSGAGALVSTMSDLRVWGRALATGSLISPEAQRERLRMVNSAAGEGPFYNRYGLALGRINGWLGHTGDVPGFQTLVMHNLVADETVAIMVNGSGGSGHIPTEVFQQITASLPSAIPRGRPAQRVSGSRNRVTSASRLRVLGRARSEAGILLIQATPGRMLRLSRNGKWKIEVPLVPGRNVLRVRAVDRWGRVSKIERITIARG